MAVTDTSSKSNTVVHDNSYGTKYNTIVVAVLLLWYYPDNGAKYGTMPVTVLDGGLASLLIYAFLSSLFINTLYAYVMFARSTDCRWHILSRNSSDGSLEQVSLELATQKQEKLPVKI